MNSSEYIYSQIKTAINDIGGWSFREDFNPQSRARGSEPDVYLEMNIDEPVTDGTEYSPSNQFKRKISGSLLVTAKLPKSSNDSFTTEARKVVQRNKEKVLRLFLDLNALKWTKQTFTEGSYTHYYKIVNIAYQHIDTSADIGLNVGDVYTEFDVYYTLYR